MANVMRWGFVSCQEWHAIGVAEDRSLVNALSSMPNHRISVEFVDWDDASVRWSDYSALILRSCWDYCSRYEEFCRWLEAVESLGVPVWHSLSIVKWNADKHYFNDLVSVGVNVVPTIFIEPTDSEFDAASTLANRGWQRTVIKPAISNNAFLTAVIRDPSQAAEIIQKIFSTRRSSALLQPYIEEIATKGEWSLVFFHCVTAEFSHAVLKKPKQGDFRVQQQFGGTNEEAHPPQHILSQAKAILSAAEQFLHGEWWLYARVDGVEVDHRFVLMELEMVEPSLFIDQIIDSQPAVQRFYRALECAMSAISK